MAEHQQAAKIGKIDLTLICLCVIEIIQPGVKVRRCWRCCLCGHITQLPVRPPVVGNGCRCVTTRRCYSGRRLTGRPQARNLVPPGSVTFSHSRMATTKTVMRIHCDRNNQATNKTKMAPIICQLIKRVTRSSIIVGTEPRRPANPGSLCFPGRAARCHARTEQSRSGGQSSGV